MKKNKLIFHFNDATKLGFGLESPEDMMDVYNSIFSMNDYGNGCCKLDKALILLRNVTYISCEVNDENSTI